MEQITQTLVVTRDGHLDMEWLDELERQQRKEAFHEAGRALVGHVQSSLKLVGKGAVATCVSVMEAVDECRS